MLKLIFTLLFLTTFASADEVRLMTWNVYMLPKPVKNSHQKLRSQEISEFFRKSGIDVIFMQEAFSPAFRRTLKAATKNDYPYYVRLKKKFGIYPFMGPGLVAISKFPMKAIDHVYFDKCRTADCYASKGAQLLEISLPSGKKLHIANTHMQAGGAEASVIIRKRQLEQIRELMDRNKNQEIPQILVGDLNIDSFRGNEFDYTLESLDMSSVAEEEEKPMLERISDFFSAGFAAGCIKEDGDVNHSLLDHILYLDPTQKIKFTNDIILNPTFVVKNQDCPLSDHKPRTVTIEM